MRKKYNSTFNCFAESARDMGEVTPSLKSLIDSVLESEDEDAEAHEGNESIGKIGQAVNILSQATAAKAKAQESNVKVPKQIKDADKAAGDVIKKAIQELK